MNSANYDLRVLPGEPPVVVVTGEIDMTNASAFEEAANAAAGRGPLVLDLAGLGYLDSAGLATLDHMVGGDRAAVVIPPASPLFRAAVLMELPRYDTVDQARDAVTS